MSSNGAAPSNLEAVLKLAARVYVSRSWPVLPLYRIVDGRCNCGRKEGDDCTPGKHPRTSSGLSEASIDLAVIDEWFSRWPESNLAILTGAASGLVVVDVDPKHGGLKSIKELTGSDVPGEAWGTKMIQRTGSGGFHLLYAHPDKTVRNRVGLWDGIDVKADGGYILAAPSNHLSGGVYEWLRL